MIRFIVEEGADLPKYETKLASGMDVTAFKILKVFRGDREITPENLEKVQEGFNERGYIKLRSLERILFGTGLKVGMSADMEVQVRPRSGVALKRGLSVLNSPGTVDADYTGEIGVILYNSTPFLNRVEKGERIAQLVVAKVERPVIYEIGIDEISETDRGSGSYGSTDEK
jgi:dUTP pyrophosphatase